MISNLYTWIFPAAVFLAAGIFNLSSSVKHKKNPERAVRNRIIWFSLNISIAFCFIAVSSFFVNWSEFVWSSGYLYFSLIVFILFYISFVLRFIIGLPLIILLTLTVLFFSIYFQEWRPVPDHGVLGQYRILSSDKDGVTAELSVFDSSTVFIEGEGTDLVLDFEIMEIDRILFFIASDNYYRISDPLSKAGWADTSVDFIAEKTCLLSREIYSVKIINKALFLLHSIVMDVDHKKIFIGN